MSSSSENYVFKTCPVWSILIKTNLNYFHPHQIAYRDSDTRSGADENKLEC